MQNFNLNVREAQQKDIELIAQYWFTSGHKYLESLGVDISKMPHEKEFKQMLDVQIALPYNEKKAYALIWEADGKPIGHTNVNPVLYGREADMHIHIWSENNRKKGYGLKLIQMSLPYYFNNLHLKRIVCEPYALNPSPNKTLEKAGFTFVKEYITTPGAITFEQPVKQWEILRDKINGL